MKNVVILIILALAVVGGYFGYSYYDAQATAAENRSEENLRARVNERWDAIMKFDFRKAFTYSTPAYQKAFDVGTLSAQFGGQVQRTGVDVKRVEFKNDEKTDAVVYLGIRFLLSLQPGFTPEHEVGGKERWQFIDDQWYFVDTL